MLRARSCEGKTGTRSEGERFHPVFLHGLALNNAFMAERAELFVGEKFCPVL